MTANIGANAAKRRYVLRPQIDYSCNSSVTSEGSSQHGEEVVSGILDGITSLCLGPTSDSLGYRAANPRKSSSAKKKKRVVYPIASYPARLNCQKLVSQRREVFHQNLFRPVSTDEMSQFQSIAA
jgi:hypothetical protein